jgi:RsmE family RNA methyltransferase
MLEILDVEVNDTIKVCLINHGIADATVCSIKNDKIILLLNKKIQDYSTSQKQVERLAFVGLARPQTVKKVLQYGTTMGITHFYFLPTELSEKSYATAKIWGPDNYVQHLYSGLAQSNHFFQMPIVEVLSSWKQIPARLSDVSQRYLCSWKKTDFQHDSGKSYAIAIGPERGWIESEEEFWRELAFRDLSLGPSVLRVECALVSALTKLN